MRRLLRIGLISLFVLLLLSVVAVVVVRRATRHVPEFYATAIQATASRAGQREMSDRLERDALELHNEARRDGDWEAVFTDAQLNAWAATVLPVKFPDALPAGVSDPRMKFTEGTIQAACQFKDESLHLDTVLSVELQLYLTEEQNEIAIRVCSVRAGWMPLLRKQLVDRAVREARAAGVQIRRTQQDDDPILLVRMAKRPDARKNVEVHLKTLEIRDGEIYFAGETVPVDRGS